MHCAYAKLFHTYKVMDMANQRNTFILIIFFMCDYANGACPSLISTATTNVICKYNNEILQNCISPMEGTAAILSCNSFYEEPSISANPIRFCREGSWDAPVPNCYPKVRSVKKDYFNQFLSSEFSRFKRQLSNNEQSCDIPIEPPYTKYRILGNSTASHQPGDYVPTESILNVSCDRGYSVNPLTRNYSICADGKWSPLPTKCIRACPSLYSSTSTLVNCSHEDVPLPDCQNPVEQTRVMLSCTQFHVEYSLIRNPNRVCNNGRWILPVVQCYPICGLTISARAPNKIKNGTVIRAEYPWHVGVYNTKENFICSGSIINTHVILSAAHCFTDYYGNINPSENYFIAAGKYYSEYNDTRDKFAQYSKVLTIHIPGTFKGLVEFYNHDIAVLIINPLTFSEVVQSVCIQLSEDDQSLHFSLNETGLVTGWSRTNEGEDPSDELKEMMVSYIPYDKCHSEVPENYTRYISRDKICGANINPSMSVCGDNAGAGLYFKSEVNDRYYLLGIVSTSLETTELACNSSTLSVFTNYSYYNDFVKDYLIFYYTENVEQPVDSLGETENKNGCQYPNFTLNGKYILSSENNTFAPGDYLPLRSLLTLTCDIGYEVGSSGATQFMCTNQGDWFPTLETCEKQLVDNDDSADFNYIYIIVIVAVVVFFAIALFVLLKLKFKKEMALRKELKLAGLDSFQYGDLKRLNPELGIDDQADLLPYNSNYEFSRDKLELGQQLGSGTFGIVLKADAFGIISNEEKTTVAVKIVKNIIDHIHLKALISELKVMIHLGQHLNVVNLLGACTENITKGELLVIVEYCRFGNIHNYLLQNRQNYIDQIDSVTGNIDYSFGFKDSEIVLTDSNTTHTSQKSYLRRSSTLNRIKNNVQVNNIQSECTPTLSGNLKEIIKPLFTKDLISWSFQIARGMEYLASRKVLHGDLAARNILLAENNIVKICDFGLSKRIYRNANYKKNNNCPLPFKWLAVESIRDLVFSTQSDVWSYGIVLWELFSLAQTPYPGMEPDEKLYQKLLDGYKMESPPYAPKEMYKTMCDCWNVDPLLRPSFNELAGAVGLMLEENIRQHYIDLNDPYFIINTRRLKEGQTDHLVTLSPPDAIGTLGYICVKPSYPAIDKEDTISNNEENIVDISDM